MGITDRANSFVMPHVVWVLFAVGLVPVAMAALASAECAAPDRHWQARPQPLRERVLTPTTRQDDPDCVAFDSFVEDDDDDGPDRLRSFRWSRSPLELFLISPHEPYRLARTDVLSLAPKTDPPLS